MHNMIRACTAEGNCFSKMRAWMQSLWADLRRTFGSDRPQEDDQAGTQDDHPPESVSDGQESQCDSPRRDQDQRAMEVPEQTPPLTAVDMLGDALMNTKDAPDIFAMLRTNVRKEEMEAREKVTTKKSEA